MANSLCNARLELFQRFLPYAPALVTPAQVKPNRLNRDGTLSSSSPLSFFFFFFFNLGRYRVFFILFYFLIVFLTRVFVPENNGPVRHRKARPAMEHAQKGTARHGTCTERHGPPWNMHRKARPAMEHAQKGTARHGTCTERHGPPWNMHRKEEKKRKEQKNWSHWTRLIKCLQFGPGLLRGDLYIFIYYVFFILFLLLSLLLLLSTVQGLIYRFYISL